MELAGIPESIPIAKVQELMASLGIDLNQLTQDGLFLGWNVVKAAVYSTNSGGYRYLDDITGEPAVHQVTIPVDHTAGMADYSGSRRTG